jgi:hypothetical protein
MAVAEAALCRDQFLADLDDGGGRLLEQFADSVSRCAQAFFGDWVLSVVERDLFRRCL